jgi:hypothetical protein
MKATPVKNTDRQFGQRVKLSYAVSSGLNLFALVLLLVSMQMEGWFFAADASSSWSLGLGKGCSKSLCTQLKFQTMDLGICKTSGSDLNSRIDAIKWLLYLAIAAGLLSIAAYAYGSVKSQPLINVGTGLNLLAFVLEFISLVVFVHTTNAWIYCGTDFCTYKARFCSVAAVPATCDASCYFGYGGPFVMAACATVLFFVGMLWSIVSTVVRNSRRQVMNKILQSRGYSHAPVDFQAPSGFDFDQDSGLYYSWSMQLYLDPVSCHYYDPHSSLWYNPDTQAWYNLQG